MAITKTTMFDIILLGASNENIKLAKELQLAGKHYALIAAHVKNPKLCAHLHVINDGINYIDYLHGLVRLTSNSELYCCNKLVISTGTRHSSLKNIPDNIVFYRTEDVNITNDIFPGIIIGDGDEAGEAALKLAKKSRYIYICCQKQFNCSEKIAKKLESTKNIIVLSNTEILKYKVNEDHSIKVKLNTYDTLTCGYIVAITERVPVVPDAVHDLFTIDATGRIIVNKYYETQLMRNIFAIGECTTLKNTTNWKELLLQL